MKKIIALIGLGIVLSNFSFVSAQLYLGGSVNLNGSTHESTYYYSEEATEFSGNYLRISPQVGYFLSDKILVGMGIGFSNNKSKTESEYFYNDTVYINIDKRTSNSIVINPFVRHYIPLSEKISLYNQLGIRYSFGKTKYEDLWASDQKTYYRDGDLSSLTAYLKPSISVNISEKLSMEFSFIELYFNRRTDNSERWNDHEDSNIVPEPKEERENTRTNYGLKYNSIEMGLSYKF